jgi:hypothetical protein
MAEWSNGEDGGMADGMAEWRPIGGMVKWRPNGGMVEWRRWRNGGWNGGMVEWRDGRMAAEWRDCQMAVMATRMARMAEWLNGKNGGQMADRMAEWRPNGGMVEWRPNGGMVE